MFLTVNAAIDRVWFFSFSACMPSLAPTLQENSQCVLCSSGMEFEPYNLIITVTQNMSMPLFNLACCTHTHVHCWVLYSIERQMPTQCTGS